MLTEPGRRALAILFDTFWSREGWKREPYTDPDDLAYATAAGYMFPSEGLSHDQVGARVLAAAKAADSETIANAFLCSLTGRRLEMRSALGSYAVARVFPRHKHTPWPAGYNTLGECAVCGCRLRAPYDRSILNFERFKWGGVRHLSEPYYCAFDLEQFGRLDVPSPTEADRALFRRILDVARSLPPAARPRDLEKALSGVIPSNSSEREYLINILGYCGILAAPGHLSFGEGWVNDQDRELPRVWKLDWRYPVAWWRGGQVSDEAVARFFPSL